jgi:hypothetical protein
VTVRNHDLPRFWPYLGRFTLVHVATYAAVASVFLAIQRALPAADRVTLDYFVPYRPIGALTLAGQVGRGVILALVLYPFAHLVLRAARGRLILFGALWGLAIVGSVEPMPGSIEGVIYVLTSATEHALVLVATAIHTAVFAWVFLAWQPGATRATETVGELEEPDAPPVGGFVARFTAVHVVTYTLAGVVFFALQDYSTLFATEEMFAHFRPLSDVETTAIPAQLVRGPVLALLMLPFAGVYLRARHGWTLVFVLLWGLTHVGSPLFAPAIIVDGLWREWLAVGTPEVTVQMLAFALTWWAWERRAARRRTIVPARE